MIMALRSLTALIWGLQLSICGWCGSCAAQVVPQPRVHQQATGVYCADLLRCDVVEFEPQVEALRDGLERLGAVDFRDTEDRSAVVVFKRATFDSAEQYKIVISAKAMEVTAGTPRAMARATATLLQLVQFEDGKAAWPVGLIEDHPDLDFRCFMVDMGRNPHSPKVLRQIVDACWFYKVSYLQLHLTDDQLFSWPSRAFPKLFDERSGWTWDAFVELEAYSQARGVTIIPEVDVPGHSTILRQRYPEVFGQNPTELATLPEAQRGIERLLDEFISVFRATPFVHVGGDEAYGVPGDVQRDFLNRLHRYLKTKGRGAIAWEGPELGKGEHKVDTDVLQMNWRTVNFPAQDMVDAGYEVVNAAWDPMYIVDHYPQTMFTAVPVRRCYEWNLRKFAHVNHGMSTFAKPHVTKSDKRIVGFCMPWWEGREQNVLGLCVPRLAAVTSAAWNRQGESDFSRFEERQAVLLPRLEKLMNVALPRAPMQHPGAYEFDPRNLAYGANVTPSSGASQPVFGPQRLTNGLKDRFDHFLGYPTQPDALEIVVDLGSAKDVSRVVVHETSVGGSHEIYELLVSTDGRTYDQVGAAKKGTRGKQTFIEHTFDLRKIRFIKVETHGCHGLTFPSFSRLCEIEVFAK
jgi:N-acetyl-beta-hexosaminidase